MNKDLNFVAKLEKAIKDKYGEEAIANPKKYWNKEKEQEHSEQIKEFYKKKFFKDSKNPKENYKGFLISKKLLTRESIGSCPVCDKFFLNVKDELYVRKYECCESCFIQYVEGREERWSEGWRPEKKE